MTKTKLDFSKPPELPTLEENIQAWWQETDAFAKSINNRPESKKYVFYDGPPFATGMPHYGHLLASTIKDVIPRYWTMKGYRVERIWGWDCHGLPIENMIEKKLKLKGGKKGIEELGIANFNAACKVEVLRLDSEWEKIINRLGRWVDFKNNYKTMDTSFMESVWWGFKQLYEKDLIYQGKKVILYCPHCATPLSNFEIAMDNSYEDVTEPSNTYKYKVTNQENTYLLAWSTTPWNKLATPALAVNPDLEYIKVSQNGEFYWIAASRLEMLIDASYQEVERLPGRELAQLKFELHYDFYPSRSDNEKAGVVVADDFVTDTEGTGIVTLAIYGEDDLRVMQAHNIQLVEHVDDQGKLKPEVQPWAGMGILEVNPLVNQDLENRGLVYSEDPHHHSVPICYRCGTRLYYAPLPAWFIDVQKIKDRLISNNQQINWYPEHLKNGRFLHGLQNAPDWNISRSRYWGTPMPIWEADVDGQVHRRIIGSIEELHTWAVDTQAAQKITDIHREFIDDLEVWVDDARTIKGTRIPEVFDCWVESGSMPFASKHYPFASKADFEQNYPAQFVSEYIAQTRAWFYCMHVISTGLFDQPAFENALTTGTILTEDGTKMSKSKKNYPDPMKLINTYGVDSLRLYLMQSVVMKGDNLNFSEDEVSQLRRKVFVIWWNLLRFYLDATQLTSEEHDLLQPPSNLDRVLDEWLLSATTELVEDINQAYQQYDVVTASRLIITFVDSISTWYVRLSRDQLKNPSATKTRHIYGWSLYTLALVAAPLVPFFSELVHHSLVDSNTSIHHNDWPNPDLSLLNKELLSEMKVIQKLVDAGRSQRQRDGVKLRQPLAKVWLPSNELQNPSQFEQLLLDELNIKKIEWQQDLEEIKYLLELTPELEAEGKARELIRSIQQLRKKQGLSPQDEIKLGVPAIPGGWEEEIKAKTNTLILESGYDTITLLD